MRLSISKLSIVSCLGVILSASAAVYTFTHYLELFQSARTIEVLKPSEDVMAAKIEALLAKYENKILILGELKARQEQNALLHTALTKMIDESRGHAMNETLLWICAGVFFLILLIHAENCRARK